MLNNILNFMQITENIASSGQLDEAQFAIIANAGYDVVINLAMPNSENAIPYEEELVTSKNMVYIHIPVPFDNPELFHCSHLFKSWRLFRIKKSGYIV